MRSFFCVLAFVALVSAVSPSKKLQKGQAKPSLRIHHRTAAGGPAKRVLIPVSSGFEEIELVTMVDVLRRAGAQVTVASVGGAGDLEVVGMLKMSIKADADFEQVKDLDFDLIVSPGGTQNSNALGTTPSVVEAFRKQRESGRWFATICASTKLLLENNGLLEGYQATGYPSLPLNSASQAAGDVVVSKNLITSRGPGTAMEFALKLVEQVIGREKAVQLAEGLLTHLDL